MSTYVTSEGSALEMMVKDEEPPFGEKGSLALLGGECLGRQAEEQRWGRVRNYLKTAVHVCVLLVLSASFLSSDVLVI